MSKNAFQTVSKMFFEQRQNNSHVLVSFISFFAHMLVQAAQIDHSPSGTQSERSQIKHHPRSNQSTHGKFATRESPLERTHFAFCQHSQGCIFWMGLLSSSGYFHCSLLEIKGWPNPHAFLDTALILEERTTATLFVLREAGDEISFRSAWFHRYF